jgi:peptidoglycan/xylan/chitin deacetylase (PgdA/CDA1 family)
MIKSRIVKIICSLALVIVLVFAFVLVDHISANKTMDAKINGMPLVFEGQLSVIASISTLIDNKDFLLDRNNTTQMLEIPPELQPEPNEGIKESATDVHRPMIALTFDDGPSEHTGYFLDILERYGARATFFVFVRRVESGRDVVIRAHSLGNEIANHTFYHQIMAVDAMTDMDIVNDIKMGSDAIASIIGVTPSPIVRPPGGAYDDRVIRVVGDTGYEIIMWSMDTFDWRDRNADTVYQRIMSNVKDGDIILMHDTHRTTAVAMERVIPQLIEEGYELVTVTELLRYSYESPEPGRVYQYVR